MQINSQSVKETLHIGRVIAGNLKSGDIICLYGEFGSGKTVLTKGIARGLGIREEKVISPSFVLIREYPRAKIPLYHFDLYRLREPRDILGLGYEEYLYDEGVAVIEWAERLKYLTPGECLKIELLIKGVKKRLIRLSASGRRCLQLLRKIHEDLSH